MKKSILCALLAIVSGITFSSCSNCKKCSVKVMGVESPEQELCGEELKKAESAGMSCK